MRKIIPLVVLAVIVAFGVACSKGPAQAALTAADDAVAKVKPEAEKFVPDQLKSLTDAVTAAKAKFDQGDYTGALEGVKDIPTKAGEVAKAAAAKKDELTANWKDLSATVPGMLVGVQAKVEALVKAKKLPKGFDPAKVAALQTDLSGANTLWTDASKAFQGGDLMAAAEKGKQAKAKAEGLLAAATPPAPAEAKPGLKK
jgi:hypothetical protein